MELPPAQELSFTSLCSLMLVHKKSVYKNTRGQKKRLIYFKVHQKQDVCLTVEQIPSIKMLFKFLLRNSLHIWRCHLHFILDFGVFPYIPTPTPVLECENPYQRWPGGGTI